MRQRIPELLQIVRRAGMQIRLDRDDVDSCSLEVNTFKHLELVALDIHLKPVHVLDMFLLQDVFTGRARPIRDRRVVPPDARLPTLIGRQHTTSSGTAPLAVLDPLDRLWRSTQTVVVDLAGAAVVLVVFDVGSGRLDADTSRLRTRVQKITFGSV